MKTTWIGKKSPQPGYEVSSIGDKRFSALFAKMPDGRTIEQWYQCDIKGYGPGGTNWKAGKGKPSLITYPNNEQWTLYKALWQLWAIHNFKLIEELVELVKDHNYCLKDVFANTQINQARALSEILNEWF